MKKLFLWTLVFTLLCTWAIVASDKAPPPSGIYMTAEQAEQAKPDAEAERAAKLAEAEARTFGLHSSDGQFIPADQLAKPSGEIRLQDAGVTSLRDVLGDQMELGDVVAHAPGVGIEKLKGLSTRPANVPDPSVILQGGDTFGTATGVTEPLPYTDNGTTTGYADDYDYCCTGAGGGGGPDVVYSYTPAADICVDITLCNGPIWDTGLAVFDADYVAGAEVGCSEDFCGLASQITGLELTGGTLYYIVVDGWSDLDHGEYQIDITEWVPCDPVVPNDDCADAEAITGPYPASGSGTTVCSRTDCTCSLAWTAVWYTIDLPYALNDVDLHLCGSTVELYSVGIIFTTDCSCDPASFIYPSYGFDPTGCNTGYALDLDLNSYPGPATIYWPAMVQDIGLNNIDFDYIVDVTDAGALPGACCDAQGNCYSPLTEQECTDQYQGDFYEGEDCASFECPIPTCDDASIWDNGTADGQNANRPTAGWDPIGMLQDFVVEQAADASCYRVQFIDTDPTNPQSARLRLYSVPTGNMYDLVWSVDGVSPIFDYTYTRASGDMTVTDSGIDIFGFDVWNYDLCGPTAALSAGTYAMFVNFPGVGAVGVWWATSTPAVPLGLSAVWGPGIETPSATDFNHAFHIGACDWTPTLGACCVDFVCVATETQMECLARPGQWYEGEICPDFACPEVPENNECENAIVFNLVDGVPQTYFGDNTGATNSCDDPNWIPIEDTWFKIVTTECMDVTLTTCGSVPAQNWIWTGLFNTCPCDNAEQTGGSWWNWNSCDPDDGDWTMYFESLPAGEYWYPHISGDGGGILDPPPPIGPYQMNVVGTICPTVVPFTGCETFDAYLHSFYNYSVSGAGWAWDGYNGNPVGSAYHADHSGAQDSWLISYGDYTVPAAPISLFFDQMTNWCDYYGFHEVLISTNYVDETDPYTATWTQVYVDQCAPEDVWRSENVDISAYAGETTVHFAFHYMGDFSHQWWVDNACVLPPPIGACCNLSIAACEILGEEDCALAQGIYQGNGTVCDPDPCQVEEEVCEGAIYESSPEGTSGLSCERRSDPDALESWVVDDVAFGADATVTDLHFWCFNTDPGFDFRGVGDYIILLDDAGAPGAVVAEVLDAPLARYFTGRERSDLPGQPVYLFTFDNLNHELVAGTYWFGMRPLNYGTAAQNWWFNADPIIGSPVYFKSEYFGFPDWTPSFDVFEVDYDVRFCVTGTGGVACDYIPGDCDHDGVPIALADVIAMIGMYRGTAPPAFTCPCPPWGDTFAAEADPNGNCVALELADVVAEIAAYRGTGTAYGCVDCPGDGPPPPGQEGTSVIPSLKSKVKINQGSAD